MAAAPIAEGYAEGFFSDPHAAASGIIVEHQHPTLGVVRQSARAIRFGGVPGDPGTPTPLLGQHTAEAPAEAGYSPGATEALCRKGVVKTETPAT